MVLDEAAELARTLGDTTRAELFAAAASDHRDEPAVCPGGCGAEERARLFLARHGGVR